VRRRDYLVFDRRHLGYLNALEKFNCAYCSYGNGLIGYVREIIGRTEQYWCPIKHARRVIGAHAQYAQFDDYGDADAFRKRAAELRRASAKDAER
jgi:rRNA processing protein Gar1